MAEKRMLTPKIIESDAFLDMPLSAQALYLHFNMAADDDGFVNNPKKIQRMIGATDDDFKLLIAKRFVIIFDSGIIVIKHWRLHNYIRSDRYHPTEYTDEMDALNVKENQVYTLKNQDEKTFGMTFCLPNDNHPRTESSVVKSRVEKSREEKDIMSGLEEKNSIPYDEIVSYLNQKTGKSFRSGNANTRKHIHARFAEGYTFDDFKKVIDLKAEQWRDDSKMSQFLRPETLFCGKFEGYLNQAPKQIERNPKGRQS